MDNNRDRQTESNDVLRDALESNKSEREFFDYENETIIFRKAYKQGNKPLKDDKSEMQHTAQIRGGAVVRPLKQTAPTSPVKPQDIKNEKIAASASPKPAYAPSSGSVNQQTPKTDVQRSATTRTSVSAASVQQNRRIMPTEGRNTQLSKPVQNHSLPAVKPQPKSAAPSVPAAAPVSKPVAAPKPASTPKLTPTPKTTPVPKKPVSAPVTVPVSKPSQNDAVSKNSSGERKAVTGTASGRVIQPKRTDTAKANTPSSHSYVRSENDDFEIDEATYTGGSWRSRKNDYSSGGESASGAVISLVKAMVYIVAVIAISIGLSVFVIDTANDVFKFVVDDKIVGVTIPENATIDDLADILYDAGAVKHKWAFKLWSKMKDAKAEFIPGDYEISTTLNYDYLRSAFKPSSQRTEVRITIPEGYTVDEIIDRFIENGIGTREGFVDVINNYDFDYPFLDGLITREGRIYRLEGYLFPDTYYFYDDSSEVTVIKKMLDNFNRKFISEYYARCAELGLSVDDAIILASMVEKETRYADELGYVSSVFHNRIKYSATFPYLNSDATIMYAMAHDLGGRPDTMAGEDTEYESPYNTYTYKGLPPGPIANPSLNAIKYALYPNDTNYFYFVSDSAGRTLFATTEPEHLANIAAIRGN